jgi:hypothetical protein
MLQFLIRLLISSLLVPIVFAFVVVPFVSLLALVIRRSRSPIRAGHPYVIMLVALQAYFWGFWGAYCSSVALASIVMSEGPRWLYYVLALGFCLAPLGWMASKESDTDPGQRRDIQRGAVRYSLAAVAAFLLQALWPRALTPLYGWALNWIV